MIGLGSDVSPNGMTASERDNREEREDGREAEEELVGLRRHEVLLGEELHPVRCGVQKPGDADARTCRS